MKPLSKVEQFLLIKLMEECAEVTGACSKILEHGYIAKNADTSILYLNAENLAHELGDVLAAMHVLCETVPVVIRNDHLNHRNIEHYAAAKRDILRGLAEKRKER